METVAESFQCVGPATLEDAMMLSKTALEQHEREAWGAVEEARQRVDQARAAAIAGRIANGTLWGVVSRLHATERAWEDALYALLSDGRTP
jgi:hypothetical protein